MGGAIRPPLTEKSVCIVLSFLFRGINTACIKADVEVTVLEGFSISLQYTLLCLPCSLIKGVCAKPTLKPLNAYGVWAVKYLG